MDDQGPALAVQKDAAAKAAMRREGASGRAVDLQRARGRGRLVLRHGRLAVLRQEGSAKIRLMRGFEGEAVLINTAGGMTDGDCLDWAVTVAGGAATVTSVAAEKIYRARAERAQQLIRVRLQDGGRLDWLTQETLIFNGGALDRRIDVRLDPGCRLLLAETIVLGRAESGEAMSAFQLRESWRVRSAGQLIFAEERELGRDPAREFRGAALSAGCRAMSTILLIGPGAEDYCATARERAGSAGAASAFGGKLIVRLAARDSLALRTHLIPVLTHLRGGPLPRSWLM